MMHECTQLNEVNTSTDHRQTGTQTIEPTTRDIVSSEFIVRIKDTKFIGRGSSGLEIENVEIYTMNMAPS